jgi:hypothetical protein
LSERSRAACCGGVLRDVNSSNKGSRSQKFYPLMAHHMRSRVRSDFCSEIGTSRAYHTGAAIRQASGGKRKAPRYSRAGDAQVPKRATWSISRVGTSLIRTARPRAAAPPPTSRRCAAA